jgi:hypothetical protein
MSRLDEQLSKQFHRWELRGRGWQVFPEPVAIEPPFRPFEGHYLPATPRLDDTAKPTFFSSLLEKVSNKLSPAPPAIEPEPEEEPEPTPLVRSSLVELQASLPDKLDISKDAFELFLLNLSLCREPIAFELVGTHKKVTAQFAAGASDAPLLRRQLSAYFPEAVFVPREGGLEQAWDASQGDEVLAVEFGLKDEFMLPLASGRIDPFIGIVGALAELRPGELGLFQVLFQSAEQPWANEIVDSVTHADGKPFFVDSPELAGAAENKVARPLYAAVVRILICVGERERLLQLARDLAGSLRVFAHPNGNELIPLNNDDYPFEEHIEDVLRRQTRRTGMLLNSDELTGFVHLPSSAVRSPAFQRQTTKTKAAPAIVRQRGFCRSTITAHTLPVMVRFRRIFVVTSFTMDAMATVPTGESRTPPGLVRWKPDAVRISTLPAAKVSTASAAVSARASKATRTVFLWAMSVLLPPLQVPSAVMNSVALAFSAVPRAVSVMKKARVSRLLPTPKRNGPSLVSPILG